MDYTYMEEKNIHSDMGKKSAKHLKTVAGIWINEKVYWVLNGHERLIHEEDLTIKINKKHPHSKIAYYDILVTNHSDDRKTAKLLIMNQHEKAAADYFSFISPVENVIFHLADRVVSLVNGQCNGKAIDQCTIQPYWNIQTDEIWSSVKKGELRYHPMAKGISASIFTLNMDIPPHQSIKANSWVITGGTKAELLRLNKALLKIHTSISNEKVIL